MPPAAAARSVAFAKTTRPAISAVAPRARLFAKLDGSPGRTVVWISGPPGAGKTTLAGSYVEARGQRCLWYQVDPDDADAATLFHFLAHAARKLDAARAKDLPAFTPQAGTDVAAFARRFFRALFARAKAPTALVFDNLHAVPADGALHAVLDAAFSQVPKHCTVVVTSRSEPPAWSARLRVTGEMVCVGREDLRLDADELAAIARLRGHELSADAASGLGERTQGWAAGFVLLLEHAKLAGRLAELPTETTPQVVFDYLAGEIFDRFEPKTREFLLRIACLPRMSAEIAQSLSGEPKAARLLLNLALNNYFVSEVQDAEGRSFQFHPLLREFLRARAALDLPEALGAAHLQRAARMLREAGSIDASVSLLVEARNWVELAHVVAEAADSMLAQGRAATLAAWLEWLPDEYREADPRLLLAQGDCTLHAGPRSARRAYERAFEAYRHGGDATGMLRSACGVIDAVRLEFDDLSGLDGWIDAARGLDAESSAGVRMTSAGLVSIAASMLWRGDHGADMDALLERARKDASARSAQDTQAGPNQMLVRTMASLLRGDLGEATAQLAPYFGETGNAQTRASIGAQLAAGIVHFADGRSAEAMAAARGGLACADADGIHAYDAWLRALSAAAALSAGKRDAARVELQPLEVGGSGLRRGDRAMLHYLLCWLATLEGDGSAAQREAKNAVALTAESGIGWLECLARAALACALADSGDRRGAEAQLRGALALAERWRSPWLEFAVRLSAADTALQCKDQAGVSDALRAAFGIGREHGLWYAPGWRAREIASLCAQALREGIEPEYARSLVRRHGLVPRQVPLRVRDWPWPFRVSTFGRFELLRESEPVEFGGKGPGRPLELLKLLVALGGQGVRADQLADALWPHVDADYAHKSFTATLHRLRKLLGHDDALILRDARLSLHSALVWVDASALDAVVAEIDEAARAPRAESVDATLRTLISETFALYRGPFLPDESEQPGFIACREQVRARLLRCLARVARWWEEAGDGAAAADCYLRCIDADPLFEAPYRNLMLLYQRAGDTIEARSTYERLRTIFAARLKVMPSAETQAVLAGLESRVAR